MRLLSILFIFIGSGIGYIYYLNFPCQNQCSITSSPFASMIFGGLFGALLFQIFSTIKNYKEGN